MKKKLTRSRRQRDLLRESMCSWGRRRHPSGRACRCSGDAGRAGSRRNRGQHRRMKNHRDQRKKKKEWSLNRYSRI